MKIIQALNTNVAIGLDTSGHEVVVLGKGVGFPKLPYELTDLSIIDRSFYDVAPQYLEMLTSIQEPVFLASADLVEQAEINLDCDLNPNLAFTLADHLQFAMERATKGIDLMAPLAYDVQHLYPNAYELGQLALDIFQDYTGVRLPDSEAVNIAMHLINAEIETGEASSALLTLQVIGEIDELVEQELHFQLDKSSYHYSRFTMHLRYLIQRLISNKQVKNVGSSMLHTLARDYPDVYLCARHVEKYLAKEHNWHCNDEEVLYLMIHIHRVREKGE